MTAKTIPVYSVFKRRLSAYKSIKNHMWPRIWKRQGWFLLIISENDNMLGNLTLKWNPRLFFLIGSGNFQFSIGTQWMVWGGVVTQNSDRSPCIKSYCILNFDLSLSLSLSLSLLWRAQRTKYMLSFSLLYAKKCACTCTFANYCFEFGSEKKRA